MTTNQSNICEKCVHNDSPFFCGSYCMYGDCFESINDEHECSQADQNQNQDL